MYYCALSLEVLQHTPQISCHLCILVYVFWSTVSVNLLLGKYYNYVNNIHVDMVYCFGLAICMGVSSNTILNYNLVRFEVCMIKLRHERMLILRCTLPLKNLITSRKKINPPATTWKISNTLTRNSSHREYLNPMRNLKLLEKYQPSPPPCHQKKKISIYKKTKKHITLRKSFNHPKIASTIMKNLKPTTWKILPRKNFHLLWSNPADQAIPPMRKSQLLKI